MRKFSYLIVLATLLVASCAKDAPEPPVQPKVYPYASVLSGNENLPCGGVISTQFADSPYGFDIGKLVDNDVTTAFVTGHNDFYVLWSGKKAFALKSYAIVSAASEGSIPSSWVLSGSNDNKSWIKLDTKKGETFSGDHVKKEYKVRGASSYKYYRFTFTATAQTSAIAEIYLVAENLQWHDCDVTLYPYGTPVPADVNQHAIGDCCALAVLASMAYQYPAFIKDIITDNGDRTYTVKMYDPQGEPIDVTLSSKFLCNEDMNCGGVTGKHDVVCWSTVLEKGHRTYLSSFHR